MVRLSRRLNKIDIDSYLPALKRFFGEREDVLAVYLYGSYGTPDQTPLSDVDLGILLRPGVTDRFRSFLDLQAAVSDITHEEDVNVTILNDLPALMQFNIISTGRLIHERDPEAVSDFLERVCKLYGDYVMDYRAFCAEYDAALREAYRHGQQG